MWIGPIAMFVIVSTFPHEPSVRTSTSIRPDANDEARGGFARAWANIVSAGPVLVSCHTRVWMRTRIFGCNLCRGVDSIVQQVKQRRGTTCTCGLCRGSVAGRQCTGQNLASTAEISSL
jgi:hypothetical protein